MKRRGDRPATAGWTRRAVTLCGFVGAIAASVFAPAGAPDLSAQETCEPTLGHQVVQLVNEARLKWCREATRILEKHAGARTQAGGSG